ncbi:hypothetical protein M405DRAFT_355988 [Rhizopogon salebrosus TDB-379]|nr:hypothetical protein M405DRAFT_355988 [Rhizopogon salebrosus TDB-379]
MGISFEGAAILSIIIESILYGISTFLFGITLWSLVYQRKSAEIAHLMVAAACLLLLLSTLHVVASANNVWQGFISSEDPEVFFEDISKNTFKNIINELETLVGDAILIYRCYVVWQRIEVIIIPMIGYIAYLATGTYAIWIVSRLSLQSVNVIFLQEMRKWVISSYSIALATNLIATSILALKLWLVHRRSSRILATGSQVHPMLLIIMESGALYSLSLVAMLATYLSGSESSSVVLDMICQIIPIIFYLIIVRTAMLRFNSGNSQVQFTRTGTSNRLPAAGVMKVHVDCVTVLDPDIGEASEISSAHVNARDCAYKSRVQNCSQASTI